MNLEDTNIQSAASSVLCDMLFSLGSMDRWTRGRNLLFSMLSRTHPLQALSLLPLCPLPPCLTCVDSLVLGLI